MFYHFIRRILDLMVFRQDVGDNPSVCSSILSEVAHLLSPFLVGRVIDKLSLDINSMPDSA